MKRIYACIAIVAVLLGVAFYSSWKVQSFAEVISADLDAAAEAIRNADHPAARQALSDGAARCDQMRTSMNHQRQIVKDFLIKFTKNLQKGARSTVWLLTPRLIDYIFPFSRSLQRYA